MSAVVKLRPAFRIEKGIPMPPRHGGLPSPYPFLDMAPGDSFFVPHEDPAKAVHLIDKCRRRFIRKNPGYRYECRRVPGGARCWRTK